MNPDEKRIYLCFTGDLNFEGVPTVLATLAKHGIEGSWFVTGNCVLANRDKVQAIIDAGHYIAPHSDKHLLYADWNAERTPLVTTEEVRVDLEANMVELAAMGVDVEKIRAFIPPYEHYTAESNAVAVQMGLLPVNLSEATYTNADYTTPSMKNYRSSKWILDKFWDKEQREGMNGAIILIHPGTDPERTDKLYNHLDRMIRTLKEKGYSFGSFKEE